MKKFNWKEFKDKNNNIAVYCKTEEEAIDFRKQMHEHDMGWCLETTRWEAYKIGEDNFKKYILEIAD